jgi:hypothetical protein
MPHNPIDILSQITLVKNRIAYYQGKSLILIFEIIILLAKNIEILTYEIILLTTEIQILRKANKILSKRRKAKKTRFRQGGVFIIEDAYDILAQKDTEE